MRRYEVTERLFEFESMPLIADRNRHANIISNHGGDPPAAIRLTEQILSERGRYNFGDMLISARASTSSSLNPHNPRQSSRDIMASISPNEFFSVEVIDVGSSSPAVPYWIERIQCLKPHQKHTY